MILSIYFELPFNEIERVFFKCYKFLIKLEASQTDSQELSLELEHLKKRVIEAPQDSKEDQSSDVDDDIESSRDSNRDLMEVG